MSTLGKYWANSGGTIVTKLLTIERRRNQTDSIDPSIETLTAFDGKPHIFSFSNGNCKSQLDYQMLSSV